MRVEWYARGSLLALALVLGGCGGDGGVGLVTTPTPQYSTVASHDGSYAASGARIDTGRTAGAPTATTTSATPAISFSYNASAKSYTISSDVPGQGGSNTYGPGQLASASVPGHYETQLDQDYSRLTVGLGVNLTYMDIAEWQKATTNKGGDQNQSDFYFVYGVQTLATDMPRTGSATYALQLNGAAPGALVGGTGSMVANFGAGTTSYSLSPAFIETKGLEPAFATLTGNGTIDSAAAAFAGSIAGGGYTGDVKGLFFGPQAIEAGGSFVIHDAAGNLTAAGAMAGRHN